MEVKWELPLRSGGVAVDLGDGLEVMVRPIRETDAPALQAAFQAMSPRSRYLRFFTTSSELSESLARSLSSIDHELHWAWVVVDPGAPSDVGDAEGRGVAVARMIRTADTPEVGEVAVAVIDEYHGRGCGRLLLELLVSTAIRSGVDRLRFEVLAENRAMRRMLSNLDAELNNALSDHSVLVYDVAVRSSQDDETMGAVYEILRWIAASEQDDQLEQAETGGDPE